jgi:hypothetical protein
LQRLLRFWVHIIKILFIEWNLAYLCCKRSCNQQHSEKKQSFLRSSTWLMFIKSFIGKNWRPLGVTRMVFYKFSIKTHFHAFSVSLSAKPKRPQNKLMIVAKNEQKPKIQVLLTKFYNSQTVNSQSEFSFYFVSVTPWCTWWSCQLFIHHFLIKPIFGIENFYTLHCKVYSVDHNDCWWSEKET